MALEGFSESLSQEVGRFGIKVTIIEPSGFSTDWSGSSSVHAAESPAYESIRGLRRTGTKRGDPGATAAAILKVADSENPPLSLLLGDFAATT